jgi:hypothetical protein
MVVTLLNIPVPLPEKKEWLLRMLIMQVKKMHVGSWRRHCKSFDLMMFSSYPLSPQPEYAQCLWKSRLVETGL